VFSVRSCRSTGAGTFAATTSTLVSGDQRGQFSSTRQFPSHGRRLAGQFIGVRANADDNYVTHVHADHCMGPRRHFCGTFPDRASSLNRPRLWSTSNQARRRRLSSWPAIFGDMLPNRLPFLISRRLSTSSKDTSCASSRSRQGDLRPSTFLHIPDLDAVVSRDVGLHQIHAMLY